MDIQIRYGSAASFDEFLQIVELDKTAYGNDIFSHYDYTVTRFEKCPDCLIRAYDGEKFIGAITMYPVSNNIFEKIENTDHFFDDDISPDDIVGLSKGKNNNLLMLDFVISPEYRRKGLSYPMFEASKQFARDKNNEGYTIQRIYGYTLTDSGRVVVKKSNGVFVKDVADGAAQLFYFNI